MLLLVLQLLQQLPHLQTSISNLKNRLRDKAKATVAMIQELTEDLQSMDQDSVMEEPESVITQESDLEQEDREDYLTDPEDQ